MKAIFLQKGYNVLMIQKKQISQLVLPIVLVVAVVILAILQVHFINTQYEIEVKKLRDESARKTTEVALLLEDELLFLPLLVQGAAIQDENSQMPVIDTAIHAMEFWNKNAKVDSIFSDIYIYKHTPYNETDATSREKNQPSKQSPDNNMQYIESSFYHWDGETFSQEDSLKTQNLVEIVNAVIEIKKTDEPIRYVSFENGTQMIISSFNKKYPQYYLVTVIDTNVLSEKLLPQLVTQCFPKDNSYGLRLINNNTNQLLYTNQKDYSPEKFATPDYAYTLFGGASQNRTFQIPLTPSWQIPLEIVQLSDEKVILGLRSHLRSKTNGENIASLPKDKGTGLQLEIIHEAGSVLIAARKTAFVTIIFTFGTLIILVTAVWFLYHNMIKAQTLATQQKEFIATVTHELKTPLTVINSVAQNMIDAVCPENTTSYGYILQEESNKLKRDIDHFLLYARMNTLQNLPYTKCNLKKCIEEIHTLLQKDFDEKEIFFSLIIPERDLFVKTDITALRGLIRNLAENAIKHAGQGKYLKIDVSEENKVAVIRFIDHGKGIPKKEKKQIFEVFQRGSQAISSQTEGSGIGLNLSRRIAELYGGSLILESTSPAGSVFTLRLPLYL